MNITIKDYATVLLMLADANKEFGDTMVSIDSVLGSAQEICGDDTEIIEWFSGVLNMAAGVCVERKCKELRDELEDL